MTQSRIQQALEAKTTAQLMTLSRRYAAVITDQDRRIRDAVAIELQTRLDGEAYVAFMEEL